MGTKKIEEGSDNLSSLNKYIIKKKNFDGQNMLHRNS